MGSSSKSGGSLHARSRLCSCSCSIREGVFFRILSERTRIRTFGRGITCFIGMRTRYSGDIETYTSIVTSHSILLRETII